MAFFASLRASRSAAHQFPTVFECRTSDDGSFFSGRNNNKDDDDNDDDDDSGVIPREKQTIVSDLDGTLLRSPTSFPYFMLMAFESPFGLLRFTLLLLLSPLAWLIYQFVSEAAAINMLIFVTFVGVREADIVSAARAVLPKFYVQDVHPDAWRVFSSTFGRRLVLTANPRVMVEPFALQYLGADAVVGTELHYFPGKARRASGLALRPGVTVGPVKAYALKKYLGDISPDVGLGDSTSDHPFLRQCKEGYIVPRLPKVDALPPSKLPKTLIFHDGRLVKKPTALWALLTLIWLPMGILLAIIRMATGILLPMSIVYYGFWILGVRVVVKGIPPISIKDGSKHGVLFVCTHRTLLDPIFVSCAIKRPVSALTYSLSRLSEILSPIPTVRLSRNREKDSSNICKLLKQGDLVICPEGTTCREPFLLRFSALFAELTDYIIPVATNCHMGMFNATSARGWKALDSFCFFMNPSPVYEITFLNELPPELTCGGGKSSYEVANYIQRTLAATLNFECTNFTRKDKYLALAGHDGNVSSGKRVHK